MFVCGVVLTALINMQKPVLNVGGIPRRLFPCFAFLIFDLTDEFTYPVAAIADSFFGVRIGNPTGIFQTFGTKLGSPKHPSLWTEQLMDFLPLQYEA